MSGIGITVGFDDGPIRRHLAALALLHSSGFDRARREIGEYMKGQVQDNLDHQKLVDGTAMPQSKAALNRKGGAGKTLIDHHHLYGSYTFNLIPGGIEVGSAKTYAAIHHFGGETGRPGHRFTMTARPVLGLNADGEREVGDILLTELRRAQRL